MNPWANPQQGFCRLCSMHTHFESCLFCLYLCLFCSYMCMEKKSFQVFQEGPLYNRALLLKKKEKKRQQQETKIPQMTRLTSKGMYTVKVGNHPHTNMQPKSEIMRRGGYKCRTLDIHLQLRDQKLKTNSYIY